LNPDREPEPIDGIGNYVDIWNDDHVRLPCSQFNLTVTFNEMHRVISIIFVSIERWKIKMVYH
jgi:hypothetical protein